MKEPLSMVRYITEVELKSCRFDPIALERDAAARQQLRLTAVEWGAIVGVPGAVRLRFDEIER